VIDREEWRTVIHRRYDRAAQFGFDELDVLRGSCAEKRARLDGHGWLMRPIGEGDLNGTGA
jgi:hypothetical protein